MAETSVWSARSALVSAVGVPGFSQLNFINGTKDSFAERMRILVGRHACGMDFLSRWMYGP